MAGFTLTPTARCELDSWRNENFSIYKRVNYLIAHCCEDALQGPGKPCQLQGLLNTCYSRRIDHKHRLVYKVDQGKIRIISCKFSQ